MTDCRIRDAGAGDRAAIEAVTLSAYQQYGAVMPSDLWDRYRQNIVATLAAAPPKTQIVAEADGRIVGSVLLYRAGTELVRPGGGSMTLALPEVRLLAVAPSARGQGDRGPAHGRVRAAGAGVGSQGADAAYYRHDAGRHATL